MVSMPPIGEEIVGTDLFPSQPRSVLEAVDQSSLAGGGSTRLKRTKAERVQPVSSLRFTQGICPRSGSNSVEVPPKQALLLTRENVEARDAAQAAPDAASDKRETPTVVKNLIELLGHPSPAGIRAARPLLAVSSRRPRAADIDPNLSSQRRSSRPLPALLSHQYHHQIDVQLRPSLR